MSEASEASEVGKLRDKEERRLSKVKISIMRNPKFALWSGLMTVGKTVVVEDDGVSGVGFVPTACTNGRDEWYSREFIKTLDDKELAFIVIHENLHKAYRHLTTWQKLQKQDARLTNMACDYVINLQIQDMDKDGDMFRVPMRDGKSIALIDERFRNMNVKQVYDILKEGGSGSGSGSGGDGDSMDIHDWGGAQDMSQAEKEALQREVDQAIRQGIINHNKLNGKGAGGISRELGELLEPEVDWREQLREFVKATCSAKDVSSWRKVNRRFLGGGSGEVVYLPSLIGENVGHLAVGIDTSGSIGGKELNEFLTEVKAIADEVNPSNVDLLYWDSAVAGHEEYDQYNFKNITQSTQPKGGGGTDPSCVSEYLKAKNISPEAVIMLTDGCVPNWGSDWEVPVLWVVARNREAVADVGKTIHIKD